MFFLRIVTYRFQMIKDLSREADKRISGLVLEVAREVTQLKKN